MLSLHSLWRWGEKLYLGVVFLVDIAGSHAFLLKLLVLLIILFIWSSVLACMLVSWVVVSKGSAVGRAIYPKTFNPHDWYNLHVAQALLNSPSSLQTSDQSLLSTSVVPRCGVSSIPRFVFFFFSNIYSVLVYLTQIQG